MKRGLLALVAIVSASLMDGVGGAASGDEDGGTPLGWLPENFPKPVVGLVISDPDNLLSPTSIGSLQEKIESIESVIKVDDEQDVPVQFAIAVVEKMNLESYGRDPDEERAAEDFARQTHDRWGVGHSTKAGGTGVLIFLSVGDRIIYLSRGGAVETYLTNSRIDAIVAEVNSSLKQAKYADGLLVALDMATEYIAQGVPTWKEWFFDLFHFGNLFILCWVGLLLEKLTEGFRMRRARRRYDVVSSHLSEMDRQQAEALQGQYEAKSCPICLEDFKSSTIGSDDKPIKLLRCGHVFDETCWSQWVSTGQGNVSICPICKRNVGPSSSTNGDETRSLVATTDDADDQHNRVLQRYQQERNFRLMRMSYQFPQFVTQRNLQRWTSPTHSGSLVRDPSFVQSDPQRVYSSARSSGSSTRGNGGGGGGFSFGGGSSSGGRGGRF